VLSVWEVMGARRALSQGWLHRNDRFGHFQQATIPVQIGLDREPLALYSLVSGQAREPNTLANAVLYSLIREG